MNGNRTWLIEDLDQESNATRRDTEKHVARKSVLVLLEEAVDVVRHLTGIVIDFEEVWLSRIVT